MDIRILQIFIVAAVVSIVVHWAHVKVLKWLHERRGFKSTGKWSVPTPLPDKIVCYGAGGPTPGAVCKNGDGGSGVFPEGAMWGEISDGTLGWIKGQIEKSLQPTQFSRFVLSDADRCRIAIAILSGSTYREVQREFSNWNLAKSKIYTITRQECRRLPPVNDYCQVLHDTPIGRLRLQNGHYIPLLEDKSKGGKI